MLIYFKRKILFANKGACKNGDLEGTIFSLFFPTTKCRKNCYWSTVPFPSPASTDADHSSSKPLLSPAAGAPTWPSTTFSAAGSPAAHRSTLSAASSSPPRYLRLLPSPLPTALAVTPVLDFVRASFPAAQELGRHPLSSAAAGDAAAELRSAREDVRQLLKATSCHPILVR